MRVLVTVAISVLALTAGSARAADYSRTDDYTGTSADVFVDCTYHEGGICIPVEDAATTIDVSITDDFLASVGATYIWSDGYGIDSGTVIDQGAFCGSQRGIAKPAAAHYFYVYIDGPVNGLSCAPGSAGVGVKGTITTTVHF